VIIDSVQNSTLVLIVGIGKLALIVMITQLNKIIKMLTHGTSVIIYDCILIAAFGGIQVNILTKFLCNTLYRDSSHSLPCWYAFVDKITTRDI